MLKYIILIIAITLLLFSCEDPEQYKKISGHWECVEWTSVENPQNRCGGGNVYFKFEENKTYESKLGQTKDQGTYTISGSDLTVSPEGKLDIKVDIQKLNEDTLSFLMNAGGIQEKMVLLKK
ncbi:MAG: lipocalin family protein [Chitinophagales bacterium]